MGRYRICITDLETSLVVLKTEFGTNESDTFQGVLAKYATEKFRKEALKKETNDSEQE